MDEKRFREESIARLQTEYTKIQKRIDAMYVDKLDGRIERSRRRHISPRRDTRMRRIHSRLPVEFAWDLDPEGARSFTA